MKKLIALLVIIGCASVLTAQNPEFGNGITFKRVFTDYRTIQGDEFSKFRSYRPTWEVGYTHQITRGLNAFVPLRAGVFSNSSKDADNSSFISLDLQAQYYWSQPDWLFRPFIVGGIGFVKEFDGDFLPQVPLGLGVFIKMNDRAFVQWQSEYRVAFEEDRSNLQHGLGFTYLFGPRSMEEKSMDKEKEKMKDVAVDTDGDGIPDDEDLCPNLAGLQKFLGCPDTDGDGLHDVLDKCPEVAGVSALSGCPDSDGDGISDNEDKCPNLSGTQANDGCPESDDDNDGIPNHLDLCPFDSGEEALNGCPDADGDGVADKDDDCPNVPGSKENKGCPTVVDSDGDGVADNQDECPDEAGLIQFAGCPDKDGDGIEDSKDQCPNSAGPADNNGCPEIAKEDRETLEIAMRAVQFDLGRSTLKTESFRVLNQVAEIMRKYPDYNLIISGHTDNSGSAPVNQRLSEKRAQTCYEYLISRGISSSRMGYAGYGESRPMADNSSAEGRYLNRRVEFELIPARR